MKPDDTEPTTAPPGARDVRGSDRQVDPGDTASTTSAPVGVREVRRSDLPSVAVVAASEVDPKLSAEFAGATIAERVQQKRRGVKAEAKPDDTPEARGVSERGLGASAEPEGKKPKDASTETEALASTKVEHKPLTPTELGLPEPVNDIQRYIVSSMAAMANAQQQSAKRP